MKNLLENNYDKGIDLYCTHITHHSHCKASPHIHSLDHDNLQIFLLCAFHVKAAPTVTPLAPCQTDLQNNHATNAHDNFQMGCQQLDLKFLHSHLHSFYDFQNKYHSFHQEK